MFGRPRALSKTLNQHEGGSAKVALTARLPGLSLFFFALQLCCMVNCPGPPAAPFQDPVLAGGVWLGCVCAGQRTQFTPGPPVQPTSFAALRATATLFHGVGCQRPWLRSTMTFLSTLTHFSRLEFNDISKINCRRASKQRFHCLAHAIAQFGLCEFNCK